MRKRPHFHFTPLTGWMNDPHGIVWDGERYHMFFQYVPNSLKWESHLDWGHAISDDLVQWKQIASALTVQNEVGCWSGSAVTTEDGYLLFYTRPTEDDWSKGQVVAVTSDSELSTFKRIEPPVISSAPESRFFDFRDPQVRRDGEHFVMTIGAGIENFGGCALQFRSLNGLDWSFDGVLASRSRDEKTPIATGTVWECPQFFKLGSLWCLIVSSINPDSYQQVHYALGNYDGQVFTATSWANLGYSEIPYATTTFQDADGRSCMMSWLKESGEVSDYSGAQSIPFVLQEINSKLVVDIHPNLKPHFTNSSDSFISAHAWVSLSNISSHYEFSLTSKKDEIRIQFQREHVIVTINGNTRMFHIPNEISRAEILIDADILELVLPNCPMTLALRIPVQDGWEVSSVGAADVTLRNYLG